MSLIFSPGSGRAFAASPRVGEETELQGCFEVPSRFLRGTFEDVLAAKEPKKEPGEAGDGVEFSQRGERLEGTRANGVGRRVDLEH